MIWSECSTLGDSIAAAAADRPDGEAMVFPAERATWAELDRAADRHARALVAHGIGMGDAVGMLVPGGLDFYAAFFGAARIGAVPVPINARFKSKELRHVLTDGDVRLLLTSDDTVEHVDHIALVEESLAAEGVAPGLRHKVNLGASGRAGYEDRDEYLSSGDRVDPAQIDRMAARVKVRDVAVMMYTSGTTAAPKGCLLSHEALVRNGRTIGIYQLGLTPEDRFWCPLPVFHIGGIGLMMACVATRCTWVHPGFHSPDVSLDQLVRERCNLAYPAFDLIWLSILDHPRYRPEDMHVRTLCMVGSPERLAITQRRTPYAVQLTAFGMTEASSHLTGSMPDDPEEVRVSGFAHPLPGAEVKIVDPATGVEVGPGERGELLFRAPQMFSGYHNAPELTAEVMDPDGFFHSGDLAVADSEGRIAWVTRLKDMLKIGGENVAAAEVEDHLSTHPAVKSVQVVSAPDARYTEVACAFVQLDEGADVTEEELIDHCVGSIATFKVPRYVRFVKADGWPMSGTKVQKYVLRQWIAEELAAKGITEAPRVSSRSKR